MGAGLPKVVEQGTLVIEAEPEEKSRTENVIIISILLGILGSILAASFLGPRGLAVQLSILGPIQIDLSSGSFVLVLSFAFVAGASMILTPCGYPLLFALAGVSAKATTRSWVRSLLPFSLGIFGAMALVGIFVSLAGRFVLNALLDASVVSRVSLSALVYGSLGIFAILIGLRSLGLLDTLPSVPGFKSIGQLVSVKAVGFQNFDRRMLAFGALYGGGMAAGCPVPSYWAILFWVAVTANPVAGGLVMGVHALGYAAPVLGIGVMSRMGFSVIKIVPKTGERLQRFVSAGMLTAGVFLVSLYIIIRVGTLFV